MNPEEPPLLNVRDAAASLVVHPNGHANSAQTSAARGAHGGDNADMPSYEARYRTLFDQVPVAVCACDATGVIQEFNRRAVELWGRTPQIGDLRERFCGSLRIFYPDGRLMPHDESPMARVLRGECLGVAGVEIRIERPDGARRAVIARSRCEMSVGRLSAP